MPGAGPARCKRKPLADNVASGSRFRAVPGKSTHGNRHVCACSRVCEYLPVYVTHVTATSCGAAACSTAAGCASVSQLNSHLCANSAHGTQPALSGAPPSRSAFSGSGGLAADQGAPRLCLPPTNSEKMRSLVAASRFGLFCGQRTRRSQPSSSIQFMKTL